MADKYYVWRRSPDGHVNVSTYHPGTYGMGTINGKKVTFEILLETTDWPEAARLIYRLRYGKDMEDVG